MICFQGEEVYVAGNGAPNLYSIGVALGRIPRFCGHTKYFYPVLGHSLVVAALLPDPFALGGLIHDAQESCMSDVPTPWKTEAARRRERMLLKRIYKANGLEWPLSEEAQEAVDHADHACLVAEAHVLEHPAAKTYWAEEPNEDAVALTQYHLTNAPKYLHSEISGPIFEQAFEHYKALLDATLDRENVEA